MFRTADRRRRFRTVVRRRWFRIVDRRRRFRTMVRRRWFRIVDRRRRFRTVDRRRSFRTKKLMKQFLVLQRQGLQSHVPHHTTVEDMSNWLIKNKSLERKEAEEGNDISHLTWEVNTQLRMRDVEHEAFTELATDLSQAINSLDFTADLSYLNPEVCDEVVRALKSISQSLAFQPYSELCCPSKVVVDIVSRLLQALWSCQMESPCDQSSMALSDMSVTIVLAVVENLSRVLKAPPVAQVFYSRSTGVRMVHSLNRKIQCLNSPEDLRRALFTQSSTLISTIIEAVSTKVQRLFEAPADYIPLSSIRSWLSEPKASEVRPKCPDQLVISSELLRNIIGMIVYVVFEGHLEEDINLHYWPLINDIIHQLSLCGVKVTKKGGKANWHIGWYQILEMVTNIHTHLHHYTGTELVLKFATSARATMLTRHMVHHVVEELVKLKDVDEGTLASGSSESVTAPLITNPVKVDNITTTMTTTPVDLQSGFALLSFPPTPGFAPLSCPPPPGFSQASCPPTPGLAPLSCPPPPGFAHLSCPPPPGFAQASCPPQSAFIPASCPPPPGFPPASCHPPLTIADHICTLIQSITARSNNIVNKELEKCIDSYSKSIWADTFYCEYMKMYPSPQGIEAFSFDEERFLVVANIIGRILLNNLQLEMLLSVEDFNVDEVGSSGSVDLNLAIPETANPVKVVDITTPLTTNPVNLEVLDETLVLQSGFSPAHCTPPPEFAPTPCTPPPGFALTTYTSSPSFVANAMQGFGTKVILKQMVLLFLERLPPSSEDLESEFLTITDRICTLFQSITARFRNIVNEELEKCTDSDSKKYWAYTFYWEYMKRYPSSQCLGIEAFTCDEERCLVVAKVFAKKMCPKMLPSAADFDEAEDSGSNGSVDLNLAIPETANPVKVVDITTPLTTNPVNLEVLDETLVLQSGFSTAHCTPPPGFSPAPCTPPTEFSPALCIPPPGFALATCTSSPSFAANAMQGFGRKVILKQMVLLFLERLPPASEDLESEFLTITDRICTLFQSITARFRNIVNEELEKCTDSDSMQYWAYTFYWEYIKRYPSSQCLGIEAFTCDEERCLVVAKLFAKKMCPKMLPSAADVDKAEDSGSNGSVDLNLAILETANPVKVVDITTPLTTNPVNLEVLDETLVLQSGFVPAPCIPPPGFSPAPCIPPPGFSPAPCIPPSGFPLTSCTASPSFAANAMQGFGTKIILKQMVLLFLERHPPISDDLESEFLTIADHICTLFQSITDRFGNIVNEELEKCTDSDSKQYWAYTLDWEYMKRCPSSQCLGIEAFTCDEERCLVLATLFAKKLYPKMFLSAADVDKAEDSGSNGVSKGY
ncbi:uncharacterized protein LOC116357429 [Oncorhynchus kisutch]|uniref:uncharacterized protein LOC116357429 n=1 Tax=Oncorhynchus kisutch TaxID=8019 RepID=UPI0012DFE21D|nr:uncharacterized protein LOC116357429 [Oncorhynchus kisutch]